MCPIYIGDPEGLHPNPLHKVSDGFFLYNTYCAQPSPRYKPIVTYDRRNFSFVSDSRVPRATLSGKALRLGLSSLFDVRRPLTLSWMSKVSISVY